MAAVVLRTRSLTAASYCDPVHLTTSAQQRYTPFWAGRTPERCRQGWSSWSLSPKGSQGLPVDGYQGKVGGWHNIIQRWQRPEEDVVKNPDSIEQLVVLLAYRCARNKHVIDVRRHQLTRLDGELGQRLQRQGVRNGGYIEKGPEALGLQIRIAVKNQDHGPEGCLATHRFDLWHDMGERICTEGGEVGDGLTKVSTIATQGVLVLADMQRTVIIQYLQQGTCPHP